MQLYKKTICVFLIILYILFGNNFIAFSKENSLSFKGYISNKKIPPIKLTILDLEKESFYLSENDLEDYSVSPYVNLMIHAELPEDYSYKSDGLNIFIPKNTKFSGHISEITSEKIFNRKGYFRVKFDSITCPDDKEIAIESELTSKSNKSYNAPKHIGKASLGLLGGAVLGTLFSYKLGGLPLIAASNGYSLAAGAAAGGLIGSIIGLTAKGGSAKIEPGDKLEIIPVDDLGIDELQHLSCNITDTTIPKNKEPENIIIEILSVKKQTNDFGEPALKISFKIENKSKDSFKVNNFILKDSQGKEYFPTFSDFESDMFAKFPPNETKTSTLDYSVEHLRAKHWLILKDKSFNKELGKWEI